MLHHVAASTEHQKCIRNLKFDTLIDVGANHGQFSLLCINEMKDIKIIAFEPILKCFNKYNEIFKKYPKVKSYNVGLSDIKKSKNIYLSHSIDSSSFLTQKQQNKIFPGTSNSSTTEAKLDKLDNYYDLFLNNRILLKIDVQGYEKKVLNGAINSLKVIKFVLIELSFVELYKNQPLFDEVFLFLNKNNFSLIDISYYKKLNCRIIQGDFLFKNNSID